MNPRRRLLSMFPTAAALAACASAPPPPTGIVKTLADEADRLRPLAHSALASEFLAAVPRLPLPDARTIYQDPATRRFLSAAEVQSLDTAARAALKPVAIDSARYYTTRYGSPLAYVRAVDLMAQHGVASWRGLRLLDFGYGTVGHLRLMALCGAQAMGVDVDTYLQALYAESTDTGAVAGGGRVTLVHGRYPADAATRAAVGGPFDVVVSKNTLKRGYVAPVRSADPRQLIDLGVPHAEFLRTIFNALRPGGLLLIYNLAPAQAPADKPYIPAADGHSPFTPAQFEAAGFQVLAHDGNDDARARAMGHALGWDRTASGAINPAFDDNLFALYTIVQRPR